MTDVAQLRNIPSARALKIWRWMGLIGYIAFLLLAGLYVLIKVESLMDGTASVSSIWLPPLALFVVAVAFAAIGIRNGHRHEKYYTGVSSGIVHEVDQDSNGHLYIVLVGLNGVGVQTSQRVYFSNAMRWRSLNVGDSYTRN